MSAYTDSIPLEIRADIRGMKETNDRMQQDIGNIKLKLAAQNKDVEKMEMRIEDVEQKQNNFEKFSRANNLVS